MKTPKRTTALPRTAGRNARAQLVCLGPAFGDRPDSSPRPRPTAGLLFGGKRLLYAGRADSPVGATGYDPKVQS